VNNYTDMTLTCIQCGKEFIFSEDEQEFYKSRGYTSPHRCKQCRVTRRQQTPATCSRCGNSFVEGSPVYCAACQVDSQLEFDIKIQQLQSTIEESRKKLDSFSSEKSPILMETTENLKAAESEKAHLAELLAQKDEVISSLELRLKNISSELEKAAPNRLSPDWLGPTLNSLKEKLVSLENNQNNLIEALLQLVEKNETPPKNNGIFDLLKGLVRRRSPAQG
jgi:hypothetical protein